MGIRISELQPAANVNPLDVVPVDQAVEMTRKMTIEQISTVAKTYADKQIAYESQARWQGDADLDAAKINKSAAGERRTFVQEVSIKEVTPSGFIAAHTNVNVESGAVTETQFELPQANEERSGVMSAASYKQIVQNTQRIEVLEGRGIIFSVEMDTDNPSQEKLQAAFETVSGIVGIPPDQATLHDITHNKRYTFFATRGEWVDMGSAAGTLFTNYAHGSIRGSTGDGDVYAKPDGTGAVAGWTALKARVGNNESGIEGLEQTKAPIESPALTGTPTAPTAEVRNSSTQLATTAYADRAGRPVLSSYIQFPVVGAITHAEMFPASRTPAELFGGTWTERFQGEEVFFRTTGGNADTSGSQLGAQRGQRWSNGNSAWAAGGVPGIEPDMIRNIIGDRVQFFAHINMSFNGGRALSVMIGGASEAAVPGNIIQWRDFGFNASLAVPTGAVNQPRNRLIRVWERTA